MKKYSDKTIAAILYMYYLNNYLENDFSFDKGELRATITSYYKNLNLSEEELSEIENNISVYEQEGSDYDWLQIMYDDDDELFLQVTSLIDYNGKVVKGYTGTERYADVGLFFVDYAETDFNDLSE